MDEIKIKLLNQECVFTRVKKEKWYECEAFDLRLAINSKYLKKIDIDKVADCFNYCLENRDKLIHQYSQEDFCGETKFNYFNNHMTGDEPFVHPLTLDEFKKNLIIKDISFYEMDDNNFTGNSEKNHFIHIGINNHHMFGSGWSEIQLSKDCDNACFI